MVVTKNRHVTRNALQALAIKAACHTGGSWKAPLPIDPIRACQECTPPSLLLTATLISNANAPNVSRDATTGMDSYPTAIQFILSTEGKERFQIAPEQIDEIDGALFRAIATNIEEMTSSAHANVVECN